MSGLASLTAHYTDSEEEESPTPTANGAPSALNRDMQRVLRAPPVAQLRLQNLHNRVEITPNGSTGPLVAYDGHDSDGDLNDDDEDDDDAFDDSNPEPVAKPMESRVELTASSDGLLARPSSPQAYHRLLQEKGPPVQLPPEPPTKCSDELQRRISEFCKRSADGFDFLDSIQKKKSFRNPSIYEKLLVHCDVDELGSNFPSEMFDPHAFRKEDYYDDLARKQTEAMHKLEKEKKKPDSTTSAVAATKKSKWDQGGIAAASAVARSVAAPGLVTMPTGTKSVVISGIGSLPKPKNPVTHVGTSIASRR
ncbi:SAP30-binding protein [Galendromus occidentalis]|uniref:SAP30-binding protein n=1 Tax=Galendromus occidentalis TaxID=34638 RepID=A0AAJ6VWD3_9ACAR|nr:SAP30-binding protein [Galendromus occidentalis]